jgi:hypothetical protein
LKIYSAAFNSSFLLAVLLLFFLEIFTNTNKCKERSYQLTSATGSCVEYLCEYISDKVSKGTPSTLTLPPSVQTTQYELPTSSTLPITDTTSLGFKETPDDAAYRVMVMYIVIGVLGGAIVLTSLAVSELNSAALTRS